MSSVLARVGRSCARHPWRTIGLWLLVLGTVGSLAVVLGGTPHDRYRIPGAESQAGIDLLTARAPDLSGAGALIVLHDPAGRPFDPPVIDQVRSRLGAVPELGPVPPTRSAADGATALLTVQYRLPVTELTPEQGTEALRAATEPARRAGLQTEFAGEVFAEQSVQDPGEIVGVLLALLVLLILLRSVRAAFLPLVTALAGVGLGLGLVLVLSAVTTVSTLAPSLAAMVGLGVGIDYGLLLVVRHREELLLDRDPVEAAARATATAGRSVLVAAGTVLVSLLGLRWVGTPSFASLGYATFVGVAGVALTAITLVPALAGLAGLRFLPRTVQKTPAAKPRAEATVAEATVPSRNVTARWARAVTGRPVLAAVTATGVLLALAAPLLTMRTWPEDASSQPSSSTTRRAYDLIAAAYGPGANGPLVLVADLRTVSPEQWAAVSSAAQKLPGVATVSPPQLLPAQDLAVLRVQPRSGPADVATTELLELLRDEVTPTGVYVTGDVAFQADLADRLAQRLWLVIAIVVLLSVLLLTVALRAPVLALKAAVMNLLSVCAGYGVVTMVFQTDTGARLLGLEHATPISSYLPAMLFVVLFGLSMDYEVFLLTRIREFHLAGTGPVDSVVRGVTASAGMITSAALIMAAVFLGFAAAPDRTLKMSGVAFSVAVLVDATVIRLVLVPALMTVLGRWNWWLPEGPHRAGSPREPATVGAKP